MKNLLLILSFSMFSAIGWGQRTDDATRSWDHLLQKYVGTDGLVDYNGFKNDASFQNVLLAFSEMNPDTPNWSKNQQIAFWINAYNAFTIKLICDNYPLKSIRDIGEPWKLEWINIHGKRYSLNAIENDILRPTYKDPRVHFAINCASISCPKLYNRAFIPQNLDKMLTQVTRNFLTDKSRNKISADNPKVSSIFDWFSGDFKSFGGVNAFINRYGEVKINAGAKLSYLDYNWGLNGK